MSSTRIPFLLVVALVACLALGVNSEPQHTNLLNNGLGLTELLPGDEETVRLNGGESLTVCGGVDWALSPHCMIYEYKSDYLLESYAMEKEIYKAISDEGGKLDDKEMIEGSQCFAEACRKKVDLDSGTWCLILTNMDSENRQTNVTLGYQACMSGGDKDELILLLLGLVGGLMFLLCICTCVCCCVCSRKKNSKKDKGDNSMTATVQYHPNDMGWYVPPNAQEVYGGPEALYIQQPYATQPPPPMYQPL